MPASTLSLEFEFGRWSPDAARIGTQEGLQVAKNCYLRDGAYRPCYDFATAAANTRKIVKAIAFTNSAGVQQNWAILSDGNVATGLTGNIAVRGNADLGDDLSADDCDIIAYGDRVVFCSNTSKIKSIDSTASSTTITTHDDSPQGATVLGVFRQFLFAGVNSSIYWCDPNNLDRWPDSTDSGLAGSFTNYTGGNINAIVGDRTVLVLAERAIAIMTFTGSTSVFTFQYVRDDIGCITSSRGVVRDGSMWYFMSEHGVHGINDQGGVAEIGRGAVNIWATNRISDSKAVSAAINRTEGVIWWHLGDSNDDNVLLYSINAGAFSSAFYGDIEAFFSLGNNPVLTDSPQGTVLDTPNLDSLANVDMDDPRFGGGDLFVVGLGSNNAVRLLDTTAPKLAKIDTKIVPFSFLLGEEVDGEPRLQHRIRQNDRVRSRSMYLVKRGGRASGNMAAADTADDNLSCSDLPLIEERANGAIPILVSGVYFCTSITLTGDWTEIRGISIKMQHGGVPGVLANG